MEKRRCNSLEELETFAREFVLSTKPSLDSAKLVTLQGDLGAGKTAFTKAVAKAFGLTDTVTSPTFVIEKIYKLEGQAFEHLIHIDAYRLESGKELSNLGWIEILKNPKNIIFLEWPERVQEVLPKEKTELKFMFIDEGVREITY